MNDLKMSCKQIPINSALEQIKNLLARKKKRENTLTMNGGTLGKLADNTIVSVAEPVVNGECKYDLKSFTLTSNVASQVIDIFTSMLAELSGKKIITPDDVYTQDGIEKLLYVFATGFSEFRGLLNIPEVKKQMLASNLCDADRIKWARLIPPRKGEGKGDLYSMNLLNCYVTKEYEEVSRGYSFNVEYVFRNYGDDKDEHDEDKNKNIRKDWDILAKINDEAYEYGFGFNGDGQVYFFTTEGDGEGGSVRSLFVINENDVTPVKPVTIKYNNTHHIVYEDESYDEGEPVEEILELKKLSKLNLRKINSSVSALTTLKQGTLIQQEKKPLQGGSKKKKSAKNFEFF